MTPNTLVSITAGTGFLLLAAVPGFADQAEVPDTLKTLTLNGQTVTPQAVRRVDLEGPLYEVRLRNGDTFYSDAEGRHLVVGTLFDNAPDGLVNVTERHDRQRRLDQLKDFPEQGTVLYHGQGNAIGEITVFTDPSCPYCQTLHQDIDRLTAAGVSVRYVPYPRGGEGSPAAEQWAQVLCADDAHAAMTAAFGSKALDDTPTPACRQAVDDGFWLGQRFGIQGTPAIVLPDGEMGQGYVPAGELIQAIERSRQ
nr:DsbC family protein [uncultured Halomonas sp.]